MKPNDKKYGGTATVVALVLVLMVAFALRVHKIDNQSLWADEGASVVMTSRSASEIASAAAGDIHPPLYYVVLAGWAAISGRTEFALRYLSLLQGVLVVALTYPIGRRLLDGPAALAGTLFAAGSPLLIYYAQEARMYEQMVLCGTLAVAAALLWLAEQRRRTSVRAALLLTVVLASAAAVLSQYFGVTALIGASLVFLVHNPSPIRSPGRWLVWTAAMVAAIALVVPWLVFARGQLASWSVETEPVVGAEFLVRTLRLFSFGLAWDQTVTGKTLAFEIGLLALAAVWPLLKPPRLCRARRLATIALLAAVPVVTLYAVAMNRPVYNPKFLLVSLPFFALLLGAGTLSAAGIARRLVRPNAAGRAVAYLVTVALIGTQTFAVGRSLAAGYDNPKYARDDYRGLVRYLALSARAGDTIILNAPGQREIFEYYYHDSVPVVGLPAQRPPDDGQTSEQIAKLASGSKRIWLVLWASEQADPRGVVEGWLNEHTFRVSNRWYGGVRLVLFSVPLQSTAGEIQFPDKHDFQQGISLLGYSLAAFESQPGDALQLTLFWHAERAPAERYTVFTHLIDPAELIWGQRDAEPASGRRPTTSWTAGETLADRYGVPVVAGTPPGEYFLEVGLYRQQDGSRLGVLDSAGRATADRILLGPVQVRKPDQQPDVASLFVEHSTDRQLGPLRLLGYDLYKLGYDRGSVDFQTGDLALLTFYWRADISPARDHRLRIVLRDSAGADAMTIERDPTNGLYPTSKWSQGEIVRGQQKFALNVPAGRYRLLAGIDRDSPVDLGEFEIR